jgi:hypothetical protein
MQSHGITLAFHREMADLSRELVGPDITVAVTLERYPRFIRRFPGLQGSRDQKIHCRFQACSLSTIEVARNNAFWSLPQKVVEFLELPGASGDDSKLRPWPKSPSPSQIAVTARFVCARRRVKKAGNDERKGHAAELTNC